MPRDQPALAVPVAGSGHGEEEANTHRAGLVCSAVDTEVIAAEFVFSRHRTAKALTSLLLRCRFTLASRTKHAAREAVVRISITRPAKALPLVF